MRKPDMTFVRHCAQIAAVASIALSFAHAQRNQPAISLVRSPQAIAAARDSGSFWGESSESSALKGNYREFTKTRVAHRSAPEVFNFEFHSSTAISGISASREFRVSGGTCAERQTYAAGDVCSVDVVFTPKGPGHRTGQLSIAHSASATPL